ncbi:MAG TPA: DNA polymerase III subunit beta [Streptosporangiaceae bacterium]
MKFRVERDVLGEAVSWVARALPSRPVVPVLAGLQLAAEDGSLVLSCFDYEVSARVRVAAEVAEPGTALVPGRLLAEITRSLPPQPAEFTSDADSVSLSCGGAEFTLVALPAEEFPALPEPPAAAGAADGGVLAAAIAQVVPAASRDDTLPMLTGVCLDFDGTTLTMAATDRYRLAVRELPWQPASDGLRAAALVPARTLAEAARTMAAGTPVTVAFDGGEEAPGGGPRPAEGMISFDDGTRRLTVRLIAGEFIRYQSRFPAGFGCRAEVPAAAFIEAVRRVSLVAERTTPVRLTFGGGAVIIEAQAEGRARAIERVRADFDGSEPAIAFNPHYLLDGLTAAAGPVTHARAGQPAEGEEPAAVAGGLVRIEFTSPAKPALITWAGPVLASTGLAGTEEGDGPPAPKKAAGKKAPVKKAAGKGAAVKGAAVPAAGGPAAGLPAAGEPAAEPAGVGAEPAAAAGPPGSFRYLVVPLRAPARA